MSSSDNQNFNATNSSIGDGNYLVYAYCNDSSNNWNLTENVNFTIDTTYPLIDYSAGTPDNYANLTDTSIFVNVSLTEANLANITFILANDTAIVNQTTFQTSTTNINWTSLPYANYSYNVSAYDTLSNFNSTSNRYVNLSNSSSDSTAPQVTINTPTNTTYTNESINFTISSNENLSACLFTMDNWNNNYTMTLNASLTGANYTNGSVGDSAYQVIFWCNDTSGNINNTETVDFVVNTTPIEAALLEWTRFGRTLDNNRYYNGKLR